MANMGAQVATQANGTKGEYEYCEYDVYNYNYMHMRMQASQERYGRRYLTHYVANTCTTPVTAHKLVEFGRQEASARYPGRGSDSSEGQCGTPQRKGSVIP